MILGMAHVNFNVSDLEKSIRFYRDLLGFNLEWQAERSGPTIDALFGAGVQYKVARLNLEGFCLDLMQWIHPVGERSDLKSNTIGGAHLAFFVNDIEEMFKSLSAKAVQFKSMPVHLKDGPIKGWKVAFFSDPDGVPLEMMEGP